MARNPPQPARARATAVPAQAPPPPFAEAAPAPAGETAELSAAVDDRDAASLRAQALRAGGRRAANERVPRLDYPKRPGWHQCWINDQPGNIQKMRELGYDFRIDAVTKERITRVAGSTDNGGLMTYLMEIPQEIYNDDRKALEAEMNKIDAQIRRGGVDGEAKEKGLHVPTDPDGSSRIKMQPVR